jgi:NADPH-dependent glutamate synthase beta subunit-like oxidoreductase
MSKRRYDVIVPDPQYFRRMVKCQEACPVYTDARAYVTAIARGELELGYEIAHDPNPLSTVCGRLCGAPCETACRRSAIAPGDEPIAIRALKRTLTERYGPEAGLRLPGADQDDPGDEDARPTLPLFQGDLLSANAEPVLPGTGAPLLYSNVRWSQESLRNLAANPSRRIARVAVVGAGPVGLTVAHDLCLLGHKVVIYEAGSKTGGMMRYGVPVYRIDQQAMDMEIDSILALGAEIHFNTPIGEEITLPDLRRDFDAVFLGIGLMEGRQLNIEGAELDGVIIAIDLLLNYNLGYKVELGRRVIVVGGGDVAMDAARTALRLGQVDERQQDALTHVEERTEEESEAVKTALDVARTALRLGVADVRIISLESWDELPASKSELEEALEEGIQLDTRLAPNRIRGANGVVAGLEVIEVASVFDDQGRFNPSFKPNTERVMDCDTVILAIGQRANLEVLGGADDVVISPRGLVQVDPETMVTTAPDVFAGGDVASGPRLIISAVRDGHIAALGIEQYVQGRRLQVEFIQEWSDLPGYAIFEGWTKLDRSRVPSLPVDRRTGISVIELGYTLEQATEQASRCLECSVYTVFDGTKCILCNGCVDVCPWDCLKIVRIDEMSGEAVLAEVIEKQLGATLQDWAAEDTSTTAAMIKDDEACTRCALCAERCPTDAITMEAFRFQEVLSYTPWE